MGLKNLDLRWVPRVVLLRLLKKTMGLEEHVMTILLKVSMSVQISKF